MKLYHNYLFLFGFIYYLVCPIIVKYYNLFENYPGMQLVDKIAFTKSELGLYVFLISIFAFSFLWGSIYALSFKTKKRFFLTKNQYYYKGNFFYKIIIPLLALYNQILIFKNTGSLFTGYTQEYPIALLGQIATFNCFYLFIFLFFKKAKINNWIYKIVLFFLLENSIALLSMGSRMFVMIPFITYVLYLIDNKIIHLKKILLYIIPVIILFLAIGVWREGNVNIDLEILAFIGLAEPTFTWISAGTFITDNKTINMIEYPGHFIGTFINFIPSVLFPNKADFIPKVPYNYDTPLGADNIIPIVYGNFGIFLTPLFLFTGGFIMTYIRYKRHYFWKTFYYCACSLLPFIFFRDFQSTNKLLFTSFLLYPLIILFTSFHIKKKTS